MNIIPNKNARSNRIINAIETIEKRTWEKWNYLNVTASQYIRSRSNIMSKRNTK